MDKPYLERYNTDRFIAGCAKLGWLEMLVRCQNASIFTESTRIPVGLNYIEGLRLSFALFTDQLSFILTKTNKAKIPDGMSNENFLKLRPIIERLVAEHELKGAWLKLYEKL